VLIDGIVAIVAPLGPDTENRGLVAILGVVRVVVGILLIRHPIAGVTAVALLLGIWLIAAAVVRRPAAYAGSQWLSSWQSPELLSSPARTSDTRPSP
jgi:uncharacterized membrane protein HdeD (DUF308 family)